MHMYIYIYIYIYIYKYIHVYEESIVLWIDQDKWPSLSSLLYTQIKGGASKARERGRERESERGKKMKFT